ncbi:hypothetical protein AMJ50_02000 [Parcubacteria bacterium DG_74_3]|nr:MAG: hypothetical protein AMJ50_02000 [Parcubacteria bacterium DG_74_3]
MLIKELNNKNFFEKFLLECKEKTFLQSWNWGEFNKTMGDKIWRFGIFENEKLLSVALIIKVQAKRGAFLFLPHGPVLKSQETEDKRRVLNMLMNKLRKIARKEGADFIRISPLWESNQENIEIFKKLGFRKAPIHMHPEITWELELSPSEENLLMGMRKTTRYLIRKALENKEIQIIKTRDIKDVETFNKLYQDTVERQHFIPFSLDYLKNEFSAFNPDNQILIFLGKYKGEIVSSGIFIFWQNIAFYHHGATSLKHPKIPVSYLLQWEAIKEAKQKGYQFFNFWGIVSKEDKSHPWAGLTLFKMGFGGHKKEYVETQDLPLSKRYWLTFIFEKLRKIKRGL